MEKIIEVFNSYPDILAVFHKKKAEDISFTDIDNTFYILYSKYPAYGQLKECASVLQKKIGGSSEMQALNDIDLKKKNEIFLNYRIIYNADREKTQEYISGVLRADAAYKEASLAVVENYQEGFKDRDYLETFYSLLAVPFMLSLIAFLVVYFTGQEKHWKFFFGVFALIFFVFYVVSRGTRFLDKFIIVFYGGENNKIKQKDYSKIKKLAAAGNADKAINEYRKIIAKEPENFDPNYLLAQLLEQSGDFRGAVFEYQKCYMKGHKENTLADILYHLGELYMDKLKDKESALKNFKRVAAEYPENTISLRANKNIEELEGKLKKT